MLATQNSLSTLLAGAVEYADSTFAEGVRTPPA